MPTNLEVETALRDSASLELVFQQAVDGDLDDDGNGDDNDSNDEEVEEAEDRENEGNTMGWVDRFILNTRRKGGRQTETSVLSP